jgi:acyl carrier protein
LIVKVIEKEKFSLLRGEEEMLEKIKEMVAEQLNVDAADITEETSFKEDLGADSLDLFELVSNLEDEYEIEIPSEELEKITTVGAVVEFLKAKGVEE